MKLITLNLWGGIVYEPLIKFIKEQAPDTDIFCFQEMLFGTEPGFTEIHKARINIFQEIQNALTDFSPYTNFAPTAKFQREPINFKGGQTAFIKNHISVKEDGGFTCYKKLPPKDTPAGGKMTGCVKWITIDYQGNDLTIVNLHGLWQQSRGKDDTPERLTQSRIIKDFLAKRNGKKIICGDFNLNPDSKSVAILEEGMKNLITENRVTSTRSSFYKKETKFADYILISPDIKILNFEVLQDEVSDHLPLSVEFS